MATWTAPATFSSTTLTAAQLNAYIGPGGNQEYLHNAITNVLGIASDSGLQTVDSAIAGARVRNSANISVPNNTWTALTFDSERFDSYDDAAATFHSTSSNTGRLVIPVGLDGYYFVGGHVEFAADTTNRRGIRIVHSVGATEYGGEDGEATAVAMSLSTATYLYLAAGEYVTLEVFQNSGGALNVLASGNYSPEFWITRHGI